MFSAIGRILKTPDLRRKIAFTLGIIVVFRLGSFIPSPFVDFGEVQRCIEGMANADAGGIYQLVNLFSGGALLQLSIFALGIMPYITASIITQLLRAVIPHFEALHKEGQAGQAKLTQYTRILTLALATLQSATLITVARSGNLFPNSALCQDVIDPSAGIIGSILIVITMTAGTVLIMWFGELITERGIGNGMSLLIFSSIVATFPDAIIQVGQTNNFQVEGYLIMLVFGFAILMAVVFVEQSQRRIRVEYAKRMVGRRAYGGHNTYIPIKVNMAGVIPVIFASSLLFVPTLLSQFNSTPDAEGNLPGWVVWIQTYLASGDHPLYMGIYFLLIIGFTYFYVSITFNPVEVADNMKKYGGFIPGIRAGRPTAEYLDYVLTRITFPGALYLGVLSLIPLFALSLFNANQNFPFGGASLLIIVGVGLDTVKQIDSQLQQRHYEGLLK